MTIAFRNALRLFGANPVVSRDLRIRMRGSKAFWNMGAFLLFLGLLCGVGYSVSTRLGQFGGSGVGIVEAQQSLQQFYYFIFETLAAMVCLIAPGLTAAAITSEKQRLTMDLLVTTPMTSEELLVGKLISSTAFLLLLLFISLPAAALCVILGGATINDVFQVYALLAIDGVLLATFGISVSCSNKANLPAIVSTYASVIGFLILTAVLSSTVAPAMMMGGASSSTNTAWVSVCALNPFLAVYVGTGTFQLFSLNIPVWVGTAFFAFLIIRMVVTAASYRLGNYGGNPVGSLRRQWLFFIALSSAGIVALITGSTSRLGGVRSGSDLDQAFEVTLISLFIIASLHLPNLFAPVASEMGRLEVEYGSYSLRRAFSPAHSGSLPFFHMWLVALIGGGLISYAISNPLHFSAVGLTLCTAFYLSGFGFLFWAASRRASSLVRSAAASRPFAFAIVSIIAIIPFAMMGLLGLDDWTKSAIAPFWLFYPLLMMTHSDFSIYHLLWSGVFCYLLGIIIFPFWRPAYPAEVGG